MNMTQDIAKPFRMQPATPSATAVWKKIFLRSLWSANAPQTGPRIATTMVTTEIAME